MATGKACAALFVLGLLAGSIPAEARSLQQADLLSAAGNLLGGALNTVEGGLTSLVTGLFGPQNTFFTQIPANIQGLSWSSLQNLDINQPISSFLSTFNNLNLPSDIFSAQKQLTDFVDKFCTPASCTQGVKVPSSCATKSMIVRLAPWQCSLFSNGTLGCTPPFVEILSSPANCAAKHTKAAIFTGQECRLQKTIGDKITKKVGGQAFSVKIDKNILNIPASIASSLLPGVFDLASPNSLFSAATGVLTSAAGGVLTGAGGVLGGAGSALSTAAGAVTGLAG